MENKSEMKDKLIYLPGLNGLRAIAALSVVVAHIFSPGGYIL